MRFTANKAQIPCKVVKRSAVKNLFDLKYATKITIRYMARKMPSRILPEFILSLLKNIGHIIFIILMLKLYLETYNRLVK